MSLARAQAEKDKGNAAFKTGDFPTAVGHYSAAIVADSTNATYPLNRAAAYLKLGKNEDAERDCTTVLKLDPKNVKAVFRRGQARIALQKLREAKDDFQKALALDPANDAAKQELKNVDDALKVQTKLRPKQPMEIPVPSTSASTAPRKPKRRRIPIEIVEPPAASSAGSGDRKKADADELMTPVSSRPLGSSTSTSSAQTPTASTSQVKPVPKTFQEAKDARTGPRPGGGIFRSNGQHTIFGERGSNERAANGTSPPAAAPAAPPAGSTPVPVPAANSHAYPDRSEKSKAPMTLFAFAKQWEKARSADERWSLLNEVPPPALPALFQSSLDASLLVSLLSTLRDVLLAQPSPAAQVRARAYMQQFPRVPRFSTVVLFMSADERALAREVWEMLGQGHAEEATVWGLG